MSRTPRYIRPHPGLYGSTEFVDFVKQMLLEPELRARGVASVRSEGEESGFAQLGVHESDADEGYVNVRLDDTGEVVRARFSGFVPGYRLEVGDELAVEFVDGRWRTIPEVRHTIRHTDRIEFWGMNRISGGFRRLAVNHYE